MSYNEEVTSRLGKQPDTAIPWAVVGLVLVIFGAVSFVYGYSLYSAASCPASVVCINPVGYVQPGTYFMIFGGGLAGATLIFIVLGSLSSGNGRSTSSREIGSRANR